MNEVVLEEIKNTNNGIEEEKNNEILHKSLKKSEISNSIRPITPLTDEEIQKKKHELFGSSFEKNNFTPTYNFPSPN